MTPYLSTSTSPYLPAGKIRRHALRTSVDDQRNWNQTKDTPDQAVLNSHEDCTFEECDVCRDLTELEKEIHEIEDMLRNRVQKCITLKTSRNASHSPFTREQPVEIISRIFSLVDQANDYSSVDRLDLSLPRAFPENYFCAPVLLSGVCSRWREIALGQSELWTKVCINICRKPDQLTKEWLDRSRQLPLTLTL